MDALPLHVAHGILERVIDDAVSDGDLAGAVCAACVTRAAMLELYESLFRKFLVRQQKTPSARLVVRFRIPRVVCHIAVGLFSHSEWKIDCALELAVNRRRAEWTLAGLTPNVRRCLPTEADCPTYARNPVLRDLLLLSSTGEDATTQLACINWPDASPEGRAAFSCRFSNGWGAPSTGLRLRMDAGHPSPSPIDITDALGLLRDAVLAVRFDPWHSPTPLRFPHLLAGWVHKSSYRTWLSDPEIVRRRPTIFVPCFWADVSVDMCADLREGLLRLPLSPANDRLNVQVFDRALATSPSLRYVLECFADAWTSSTSSPPAVRLASVALVCERNPLRTSPVFDDASLTACARIWGRKCNNNDNDADADAEPPTTEIILKNAFLDDPEVFRRAATSFGTNRFAVIFYGLEHAQEHRTLVERAKLFLRGMTLAYACLPPSPQRDNFAAEFSWVAYHFPPELDDMLGEAMRAEKREFDARCGGAKRCAVARTHSTVCEDGCWVFVVR